MKKIIFLGDGRSYHVVDWYTTVVRLSDNDLIKYDFFTDLIHSEGHSKLLQNSNVNPLYIIDNFLVNRQSLIADRWRNLIKFLYIFPQVVKIKRFLKANNEHEIIFHAHSFYYILLCSLSGAKYIATPMGSDYLLKPDQSKIYSLLANYSLSKAWKITVDSLKLKEHVEKVFGYKNVTIIQNGIDTEYIANYRINSKSTSNLRFLSIRGLTELYQIKNFLEVRNLLGHRIPIDIVYPFKHYEYEKQIEGLIDIADQNIGRVNKDELYRLMANSFAVISTPVSDSSPRSVYEAIFCGAIVITTNLEWIKMLTPNMKNRIVTINSFSIEDFKSAIEIVESKLNINFTPTDEDIIHFDQNKQMNYLIHSFYLGG